MKKENREALNKKADNYSVSNKEAEKEIRAWLDKAQRDSEKK